MANGDMPLNVSRRTFLGGAAAGTVAGAGGAAAVFAIVGKASDHWNETVDVIVVGGGAGGCSAAITAYELGSSVVLLEKAPVIGGTSAKSVGGVWVPNNRFMQAAGTRDNREDCVRYMVRLSFPDRYNADSPRFGASEDAYVMMQHYYDNARRVVEQLDTQGALKLGPHSFDGHLMPDYFAQLPENKAPVGRVLYNKFDDDKLANGSEMMRRFGKALSQRNIPVKKRCRARQLIKDDQGAVLGVVATDKSGTDIRIRANKGVIFATGGFTHNPAMAHNYLKGPIFGGCAVPTNEGDFVNIGVAAGAQLGNMTNAWWAQIPFDQALESPSVPTGIWSTPGDSMIQVNSRGERFLNEKFVYNERTQAHFYWDAVTASYPNLLSFIIYDQRTADQFAGFAPIPVKGSSASFVIYADNLDALATKIAVRLDAVKSKTGGLSLAQDFSARLKDSILRFNESAQRGRDEDFHRGESPIEVFFHFGGPNKPVNPLPNPTMHPISDAGPYYAIIMAPGTLDTKGGPVTNEKAQVLDVAGKPIPGLFATGNCSAGCAGPAYWSGGATLGPAITFGVIAAEEAHNRSA